jgi:outer membrane protein OmpA-like peptidoglycan-associated protein/tetratricopeptide (TPR) repeat protein
MKKFILSTFLIASISVHAQFGSDYLKAADRYFKSGDYASAANYYEKYLQGGTKGAGPEYDPYKLTRVKKVTGSSNNDQAQYHLAESYRLLTNYEKAEPVYAQLLKSPREITPLVYYNYATVLRAQTKYAEAEQALNKFLDKYTSNDQYLSNAKRELLNLRFIQEQLKKDIARYKLQKITPAKEGASYAPVWASDNKVLFTATSRTQKQGYVNHVYQAAITGSELNDVTTAGLPEATMHEGTPALSADGNTLYLTRWSQEEGKKSAAIYKSAKNGDTWSSPVVLNNIVNEPGANTQQPVLMANGKYLLYASDKKGGEGGYDLWIAELNAEGQPVSTTNLGNGINTPFNEEAPYYHAASQHLVFASNGRIGMGGYDLFYSKGEPGNWAAPENFGHPVNSVKDDIYFAAHAASKNILENVLISSDRTAVCCLELFHVTRSYKQYFSGQVVDCATQLPVPDAVVGVTDASGKKLADLVTNSQGEYLVETEQGAILTIQGRKENYESGTITTKPGATLDTVTNDKLCLTAIRKELFTESKLEIRNILFAFDDAVIPTNDYEFLDQVAEYLKKHPEATIEIGAHTDAKGTVAYNKKLSARRAQSCYNYLVEAGIERSRLKARGYGECCPIEKETTANGKDDPAAREKNRRIEIKLL